VTGLHRLEASRRRFGEQAPIQAIVYPPDTPDAVIEVLQIEENLSRKELTAAECQTQTIRLAAALKKLDEDSGEVAQTGNLVPGLATAGGGRGNRVCAKSRREGRHHQARGQEKGE
jgi:hypothetical protein